MIAEEITSAEIPETIRALQENVAIYELAKRICHLGQGRALKVDIGKVTPSHFRKKAYVHFRHRSHRLRTKLMGGYMYMWIEERTPKRFEVASIPAPKTEKRA
jgi:hypothetical protein